MRVVIFFVAVFQVCVVNGAWAPGPVFVSALGRNLICDLFSYPVSFFEHRSLLLFFCFVFFLHSPASVGTLLWGRWHYDMTAPTYLRRCALVFAFIYPAFPKTCTLIEFKNVTEISHVIAGGKCDAVRSRPGFHEIKEDHQSRGLGWRERWLSPDGVWTVFIGEKSKLLCQTTFSARCAIDTQHWPDVACERCREVHAGKRINKPVTKVGKNP